MSITHDEATFKLAGNSKFVRHNPKSDLFPVGRWDHLEFWCADATSCARRFVAALGMQLVARSDLTSGNETYSSYVMRTNDITFVITSPMGERRSLTDTTTLTWADFDADLASRLVQKHGTFVRAVAITVADVKKAHDQCVANGGTSVIPPTRLHHAEKGSVHVAEVELYEDVVLRFLQRTGVEKVFDGAFLPGYLDEPERAPINYGLQRVDHVVSNVESLAKIVPKFMKMTGFHEFSEFTTEDVGTDESGLNSIVLASNDEMILFPFNEPTYGTKRPSQIRMYLDYNQGPGVQHIAIKTHDIFETLRLMKANSLLGGFEFVPKPSAKYYERLPSRLGDKLTPEQYALCEEYGVLADTDPEGDLLQIFTRPVFDRPTVFFEIIQRIGCNLKPTDDAATAGAAGAAIAGKPVEPLDQKPGCGGFGKGNFGELFRSIEDFEKAVEKVRLEAKVSAALSAERL